MSDARRRLLCRAAKTGDPVTVAAEIAERLRVAPLCVRCEGTGQEPRAEIMGSPVGHKKLCPECAGAGSDFRARVELAAYCDDPVAQLVLSGSTRPSDGRSLVDWVAGLDRWRDVGLVPGQVMLRAAVGVMTATRRAYIEEHGAPHEDGSGCPGGRLCSDVCRARDLIAAVKMWLACSCEEHRLAAHALAYDYEIEINQGRAWWRQLSNLLLLQRCLGPGMCLANAAMSAANIAEEHAIYVAISSALTDWALEAE